MGEIAEDILEGACCQDCGIYFVEAHGYPVLCKECWKSYSPKERKNISAQAIMKEL